MIISHGVMAQDTIVDISELSNLLMIEAPEIPGLEWDTYYIDREDRYELGVIVDARYTDGYALPPQAELIRLLAILGSNTSTRVQIVSELYDDDQELSEWIAVAYFAPRISLTDRPYGLLYIQYRAGTSLLTIGMFYEAEDHWAQEEIRRLSKIFSQE